MLNINEFVKSISGNTGLLNPTRYKFMVNGPLGLMTDEQSMKIKSVPWPGKTISTIDSTIGIGPTIKVPVSEMHENLPIEFYCSKDLNEFDFWNKWTNFMMGNNFLIKHYKEIVGEGRLVILDESGNITKGVRLVSCFPTVISPISMGYDLVDQIATFTVDLIYHHFEVI